MSMGEAGAILGLDHVTLAVAALDPAIAAYRTLFGRAAEARGAAQGLGWAAFRLGNCSLVLVAPEGARGGDAPEGARGGDAPEGARGGDAPEGARGGDAPEGARDGDAPVGARGGDAPQGAPDGLAPGGLAAHLAARPAGEAAALGALAFAAADPASAARLLERRGLPQAGPPQPWLGRPATPLAPAAARGLHLLLTPPDPSPRPADAPRLDHLVIRSGDPERSIALLAGRLGLDLRLDRSNPDWGQRLLFFRCGDLVLEVSHALGAGIGEEPDRLWGATWRVPDVAGWHAGLAAAGIPVSPLRTGRKPGTRIFTIREHAAAVPTAFIGA